MFSPIHRRPSFFNHLMKTQRGGESVSNHLVSFREAASATYLTRLNIEAAQIDILLHASNHHDVFILRVPLRTLVCL